jgi:hypothetical protein
MTGLLRAIVAPGRCDVETVVQLSSPAKARALQKSPGMILFSEGFAGGA